VGMPLPRRGWALARCGWTAVNLRQARKELAASLQEHGDGPDHHSPRPQVLGINQAHGLLLLPSVCGARCASQQDARGMQAPPQGRSGSHDQHRQTRALNARNIRVYSTGTIGWYARRVAIGLT
jgi:hypothetical protein